MNDAPRPFQPPPIQLVSLHHHRNAAAALFHALGEDHDARMFRPHPMTPEHAYNMEWKRDVYVLAIDDSAEAVAYGMLRGWDDGYDVPSLGIAACHAVRGTGIARLMMQHLHVCARLRGAKQVRLRVHPDNESAIGLYRSMGYQFLSVLEEGQHVAYLDLTA